MSERDEADRSVLRAIGMGLLAGVVLGNLTAYAIDVAAFGLGAYSRGIFDQTPLAGLVAGVLFGPLLFAWRLPVRWAVLLEAAVAALIAVGIYLVLLSIYGMPSRSGLELARVMAKSAIHMAAIGALHAWLLVLARDRMETLIHIPRSTPHRRRSEGESREYRV